MRIPILPVELEKEIFQMAAYSRPLSIPLLMRVAHRVKIWVEPLLFQVLVLSRHLCLDGTYIPYTYPFADDDDFSGIQSHPPSVLRDSVRHLLLYRMPGTVSEFILSASSAVEDLWISTAGPIGFLLPFIGVLTLQRLYCDVKALFALQTKIDFEHPLFSRLTHLELFDQNATESYFALALIPHLTHLAFNVTGFLTISVALLETCKSLRVLVLLMLTRSAVSDIAKHPALGQLSEDPRFVQMFCSEFVGDWQAGALTGNDYWSRAEDFIARRRSGEIDCFQYEIGSGP
ncbi:hypothetical protein C8F04DRAFT_1158935 [Mycena alexandri]|uniref:Uncharacterized protein n=1 Tax=Mycena alexandri TaxID=1745969 RepID=A0AAD6WKE7_9AGAR|nr:hypothetical protein C8F04DRAFT_1158935 [Mycena alexandri]